MDRDPRGTISQQGNVMRIDNAFVEEVVPANRSSNGYLLVSYATAGANRTTSIQNLRLNITRNTVLLATGTTPSSLMICTIRAALSPGSMISASFVFLFSAI